MLESSPVSGTGKGLEGQLGGDPGRLGQATWDLVVQREPAVVAEGEKVEPRGGRGTRGLSDWGVWGSWTRVCRVWLGGW